MQTTDNEQGPNLSALFSFTVDDDFDRIARACHLERLQRLFQREVVGDEAFDVDTTSGNQKDRGFVTARKSLISKQSLIIFFNQQISNV